MFRSFRQSSAKYNNSSSSDNNKLLDGEKQKQKKRLSFKDPEVEKPPEPRPSPSSSSSVYDTSPQKDYHPPGIQNFEEIYPEDQGQQNKQAEKPSRDRSRSPDPRRNSDKSRASKESGKVSTETGATFSEVKQKSAPKYHTRIGPTSPTNNQDYLEVLTPPRPEAAAMKCPVIEFIGEEADEENTSPSSSARNLGVDVEPLPTSARHQIQLLNYQLEQQRQQTQTAMYQIQLLKDQLEAESAARYKAQVHNHQLMLKNKELLDHIQKLFHQVQDLEKKIEKLETAALSHDPRQVQSCQDGHGRSQLSYRRNSGSSQSLWPGTTLLGPSYTNSSRRGSAAGTTMQQQTEDSGFSSEQADNGKRDGISSQYSSPFDTDWRAKRRGSSGNYNTLDFSRIRCNADAGSERHATSKNPIASPLSSQADSKQHQSSYGQRRSESVSGLDRASRKTVAIDDSLVITDSMGNEYGASASAIRSFATDRTSSRTETLSTAKSNCIDGGARESKAMLSTKKGLGSLNIKDSHSKLAQSLETLRLFNS